MKTEFRIGFWALLLAGIFAWAPTTYPGYWQALEGFVPIFNASQNTPIAEIATTPDLWRGMGNGTFLLTRPLIRIGLSPVVAVRVVFALCFILGGLSIYAWLRQRLGDRVAGLASVTYMFLPPLLATVYVRGSLSDAQMVALLPVALAGAATFTDHRRPSGAGLMALSILWMWRTQAGLAVFATLLLLCYTLWVERDRLTVLVVVVCGAAGLVSLIPLWSRTADSPIDFTAHFVYLFQLLNGPWQVAPSIPGWQDGYPFQLGFPALVFGGVALWLWRTQSNPLLPPLLSRLFTFSVVTLGLFVILSLGMSEPLWMLTGADRLLTYPWQLLLLTTPLLALLAGSLPVLLPSLSEPPYWAVLTILVVLSSYPYLTTEFTQVAPPGVPVATVGSANNFVLLDAELVQHDSTNVELDIRWQTLRPIDFDDNVFFQAIQPSESGINVLQQLDVQPISGTRPMTTWRPGEILTDTYRLDLSTLAALPDDLSGLEYHFGYYDWRDGTRLPIKVPIADGSATINDDKLVLHGR